MASILNHNMTARTNAPLLRQTQNMPNSAMSSIKNIMNSLRMVKNPMAVLQQAAQSNPDLATVMNMCQGRDPKDVFYKMCQDRGVDPNEILSQLQ